MRRENPLSPWVGAWVVIGGLVVRVLSGYLADWLYPVLDPFGPSIGGVADGLLHAKGHRGFQLWSGWCSAGLVLCGAALILESIRRHFGARRGIREMRVALRQRRAQGT